AMSIRGISDVVGFRRDERWTRYACDAAAAFALAFVRSGYVKPGARQLGPTLPEVPAVLVPGADARAGSGVRRAEAAPSTRGRELDVLRDGVKHALAKGSLVEVRKVVGEDIPEPTKARAHLDAWWWTALVVIIIVVIVCIVGVATVEGNDHKALFAVRN